MSFLNPNISHRGRAHRQVARLHIPDGTLEALKWLALLSMTFDHVNVYLFTRSLPFGEFGRLAMPLFAFVLAYNLARPGAMRNGVYGRILKRLFVYGLVAAPICGALGGLVSGWWPLNILFTLFASTAMVYFVERRACGYATLIFLVGGLLVEYNWPALLLCLTAWLYCRAPGALTLAGLVVGVASLFWSNVGWWAMAALPIMLIAPRADIKMPRVKHLFYAYYPLHLAVILGFLVRSSLT